MRPDPIRVRPVLRVAALLALLTLAAARCGGGDSSPAPGADAAADAPGDAAAGDAPAPAEDAAAPDAAGASDARDAVGPDAPDAPAPTDAAADVRLDAGPDVAPADAGPDVDPTLDSDDDGLRDVEELALGTDPHHADSDRDGTPDGAEVADGSDPADPADALRWQPEALGARPHLYFTAADVPALRERLLAESPPAWVTAVYGRTRSLALAQPPANDGAVFDGAASAGQGRIALAAAFVGLLEEDAALLEKAADLLAAPFPDPRGLGTDAKYNLHESEALNGFCAAFDIVEGSALAPERIAAAREGILARVQAFRDVSYSLPYRVWLTIEANNHSMKALSALGLCALTLNDQPWAAHALNEALTGLLFRLLHVQATADGGFAEGWNYLNYGANNYLPFLAAYHRFAQGQTLPYRDVATFTAAGDPAAHTVVAVPDPAVDPRVQQIWLRALWSAFPNGLLPNTDDANPSALHAGLAAALFADPRFLWNWQLPAVGHFAGAVEVPTLALLDPALEPVVPDWELDGTYPEAGFAVFRSDLGPDALWALVQGENGPVRVNATGHEHPDGTNLLLWYGGEPLLIDPGYIDWTHHERVNQATDHNLVLVDGVGPPGADLGYVVGTDAFLEEEPADEWLRSVVVRTTWARTAVQRRVVRVAGRFFLLDDRLDPEDGSEHTYTFQMNGNGGEDVVDGTFELLATGARWERPAARVRVEVQPVAGAPLYGSRAEEHAGGGGWLNHAVLTVDATMPAPAGFLTVLSPSLTGGLAPGVVLERPADGVSVARVTTTAGISVAVLNRTWGPVDVPGIGPHGAVLTAPVGFSFLQVDINGAHLHHRSFDGGALYLDSRPL